MSLLDKVVAAVTPPESDHARAEARTNAQALAGRDTWFAIALEHHDRLRDAFAEARAGGDAAVRGTALQRLRTLLLGHAQAEESILYPALGLAGEKAHAGRGYDEQAMVKMQMAELDGMAPMTRAFLDKLKHIEAAVLHHMYEEEGTWFPELLRQGGDHAALTRRFREEFERYVPAPDGGDRGP